MRNIYTSTRMLDTLACSRYGLTEDILMENAAAALEYIVKRQLSCTAGTPEAQSADRVSVLIITGSGNNGGDGMALARRLCGTVSTAVYIACPPASEACRRQTERARLCGVQFAENLIPCTVLVDCLFGSGFRNPAEKEIQSLIERINAINCTRIACDIPSGIDAAGNAGSGAVRADITVCMGALKAALFSDGAKDYTGAVITADLGIGRKLFEEGENCPGSDMLLLEKEDIRLPRRLKQNVHKGNFGHCAIISGEKEGASVISALAAFSFGAGLVTLIREQGPLNNCPWECMQSASFPRNVTAIAAGMGMGELCAGVLEYITAHPAIPCVLDADMLRQPQIKTLLEKRCNALVLTPHPKEFRELLRICGLGDYDIEAVVERRAELVRTFCSVYPGSVLLLKGANTLIGFKERLYINTLGLSGLAKGGSGDVLSGLICALLAQGYTPPDAAIHASLAHSLASRTISSTYGLTPMTLIEAVRDLEV